MDSASTVHSLLKDGEARFEAAEAVASADIHSLMARLKAIYERWYGRVALDIHDWRWQAQALHNHIVANGAPTGDPVTPPPADATHVPPNRPGDPHTRGMGEAPMGQGALGPVSTAAPGTPTSMGTPTMARPVSIKPAPDANDPTDTSFIKTTPDVTVPAQGGVTDTPGSPAVESGAIGAQNVERK